MNLPIYKALIEDSNDGILAISLVEFPATEVDFQTFSKEKEMLSFNVVDEEKREILCVVMRADYLIYRRNEYGFEYYIYYDANTIKEMAQKLLKDHLNNSINIEHTDEFVNGVEMIELFIKDTELGINPKGFEEVSNGSLFTRYKVLNNDIWNKIKDGTFKSISLEGYFSTELVEMSKDDNKEEQLYNEIIDLLNKIRK